jgi:small subunit ribosomal protein S35
MEFCTSDLPLTPAQRLKLIKLAGPRYDPQTDAVKMSCESFSSQAQNKRYLGDLIGNLLRVAKGEGSSPEAKDSFADVPVDFRHVKWKQKPKFPESWKLNSERRQVLKEKRTQLKAAEQQRLEETGIVDGMKIIEESYAIARPLLEQRERAGRTLQGRVDRMQGRVRGRAPGVNLS